MRSSQQTVKIQLRDEYKDCTYKTYADVKEFLLSKSELEFSKGSSESDIISRIGKIKARSRVWLLFAKNGENNYICLQVAQSKKRVISEIERAVGFILAKQEIKWVGEKTNSAFYEKVCPPTKMAGYTYPELLYSMIGNNYEEFKICFLDVNKYLEIKPDEYDKNVGNILEICKHVYAEAKIAYETLAVYWKLYPSGIDGQTIAYFAEQAEQQKKRSLRTRNIEKTL